MVSYRRLKYRFIDISEASEKYHWYHGMNFFFMEWKQISVLLVAVRSHQLKYRQPTDILPHFFRQFNVNLKYTYRNNYMSKGSFGNMIPC